MWRQDISGANLLIKQNKRAEEYICVDDDKACLCDPIKFSEEINNEKLQALQSREGELRSVLGKTNKNKQNRVKHTLAQVRRLALLWNPCKSRLVLRGIIDSKGHIVRGLEGIGDELAKEWSKVFSSKPIDVSQAKQVLKRFAAPIHVPENLFPNVESISHFLAHAKHSAPGPDGIPYCAWKATGARGAGTMFRVLCDMWVYGSTSSLI